MQRNTIWCFNTRINPHAHLMATKLTVWASLHEKTVAGRMNNVTEIDRDRAQICPFDSEELLR